LAKPNRVETDKKPEKKLSQTEPNWKNQSKPKYRAKSKKPSQNQKKEPKPRKPS